jgi:aminomuconate-semialdehyde/2-hydroxymuconate-6-semialdehyde dehydrogenase
MTVAERVELLYAVADEINRRFDDFLQPSGRHRQALSLASHIDIPRGAANFKIFADVVKNVPTESFEMATPDGAAPSTTPCVARWAWWAWSARGTCRCC